MKYHNYNLNPRVSNLVKIISEFPGLTFTEIMSRSGLANGVLSHYLLNMEKKKMIRTKRGKKNTWYFAIDEPESSDLTIISMRKETCKKILVFLLSNHHTFSEITNEVKKSPATVSFTLAQLLDGGIIKSTAGFPKRYAICDRNLVLRTLERIDSTTFDIMKDRFADAFSYF